MNWSPNINKWLVLRVTVFTSVAALLNGSVQAETFQKLFDFDSSPRHPSAGLCKASDGYLYGSTRGYLSTFDEGRAIFRMTPQGEVTILNRLPSGKGLNLGPFTEGNDGNLYAVNSPYPGTAGIVRVSTSGGLETVTEFTGPNRWIPPLSRLVKGTDGALYGVTHEGGTANQGTVFRVTESGQLTTVHSFSTNAPAGYHPMTLIGGNDGNFYGTALRGGASGKGTIFRVTPEGAVTVFACFPEGTSATPSGILVQADDGSLFGVPFPSLNSHRIYKVTTNGAVAIVANLSDRVGALAKRADGNLYAVSSGAATRVYKLSQDGQLDDIATTTQPLSSVSELVEAEAATFFGCASHGGTSGIGALFKIDTAVKSISTLYSFTWPEEGAAPTGRLIRAADGSLCGTLSLGGPGGRGAIFRVVDGFVANIYGFTGTTVIRPMGGLTVGSDGNFYGAGYNGGSHGLGSVFRMTPAGAVSDVASFTNASAGRFPNTELVLASTGELYGTTESGGQDNAGTVFKISPSGTLTRVASVIGNTHGIAPATPLVEHTDGSFIGTTARNPLTLGGSSSIFKMTTNGELSVLLSFISHDSSAPSSLMKATNGFYYGTTLYGGTNQWGTIFRFTPEHDYTILHTFAYNGGKTGMPYGLMQASDGFLYGMTTPTNSAGTVFRMNLEGELVTFHTFSSEEGYLGGGPLCEGPDGWLYGVRHSGGARGGGTLFRVNPRAAFIQGDSVSLTNGHAQFRVHGGPGVNIVVQRSSDLSSWTSIATNIPATGSLHFVDTEPADFAQAFYRVRQPED